jgi:hypothetical protein
LDPHPRNDHMGNMEGKELAHLQEPKLAKREDQGNNNLHDNKNGTEPQLPDKNSTTHISGLSNPRSLPPERRMQPQLGKTATTTPSR